MYVLDKEGIAGLGGVEDDFAPSAKYPLCVPVFLPNTAAFHFASVSFLWICIVQFNISFRTASTDLAMSNNSCSCVSVVFSFSDNWQNLSHILLIGRIKSLTPLIYFLGCSPRCGCK